MTLSPALLEKLRDPWILLGLIGQAIFGARFLVQWIASERARRSVIPKVFWHLSIVGSLLVLVYALRIMDPVFILAYAFNSLIYARNLMLYRDEPEAPGAAV